MKENFKKPSLSKERISKLQLHKIEGGNGLEGETRLSDTCLCGSQPEFCD